MIPIVALTLLLSNVNGFTTTTTINKNLYSIKAPSSYDKRSILLLGKEDEEELKVEVEQALKQAEDAIKSAKIDPPKIDAPRAPLPPPPTPPKAAKPAKPAGPLISKDQLEKLTNGSASAIGGVILGAALGIGIDIYLSTDYSYNFELLSTEAALPPTVLATLIGSLAFIGSSQDNFLGTITNNLLGAPAKSVGKGISSSIQNVIEGIVIYISSIPKRIQRSIQNKIDETVEEVKQIPSKTAEAAKKKADDIVTEVKATPKKVADGTKKAIVDTIENTEKQITKTVEETKEKVVKSVEETVALPGKKIKELNEKVGTLLEGDKVEVPKPPTDITLPQIEPPLVKDQIVPPPSDAPKPPTPPKSSKTEDKSFLPTVPKIDIPKISIPELPKQEDKPVSKPPPPKAQAPPKAPPKVERPKPALSIPKITIPELPKQKETPVSKPPVQDKPKDDDFIFSEVALKEIFQKSPVAPTPSSDDGAKKLEEKAKARAEQRRKEEEAKKQQQEALAKKKAEQEAIAAKKKAQQEEIAAKKKAEQEELAAKRKAEQEAKKLEQQEKQKQLKLEAAKAKKEAARAKAERLEEIRFQQEQQQLAAQAKQEELKKLQQQKQNLQKIENKKGTISLGSIFGASAPSAPTPTASDATAPKGVPTISNWRLNNDNSITGIITNSPNFPDNDSVTTSSIRNNDVGDGGLVVTTISGTRLVIYLYLLSFDLFIMHTDTFYKNKHQKRVNRPFHSLEVNNLVLLHLPLLLLITPCQKQPMHVKEKLKKSV